MTGPDRVSWALARMAIALPSSVIIVLLSCSHSAAIGCKSTRGHDGKYWAWREIDGRSCWYAGRRGIAKARLAWPAPRARTRPAPAPPKNIPEHIPPADTFADRWRGGSR